MGNVRIDGLKVVPGNPDQGGNPNPPNGQGNGGNSSNVLPVVQDLRFVMVDEHGELVPGELVKMRKGEYEPNPSVTSCSIGDNMNATNIWVRPNFSNVSGTTYYLDDGRGKPNCPNLSLPNDLYVNKDLDVGDELEVVGRSVFQDKVIFYEDVRLEGNATVTGSTSFSGNMTVNGYIRTPKLTIGDKSPQSGTDHADYKLSVDGKVVSRESIVTSLNWADFVFEEDYELIDLSELSEYIGENKHLPCVPTEEEVSKYGVNLGEMNAILLQKVEELTLYIIEQNERINKLESKLNENMD